MAVLTGMPVYFTIVLGRVPTRNVIFSITCPPGFSSPATVLIQPPSLQATVSVTAGPEAVPPAFLRVGVARSGDVAFDQVAPLVQVSCVYAHTI
jgi:hypothetical protein